MNKIILARLGNTIWKNIFQLILTFVVQDHLQMTVYAYSLYLGVVNNLRIHSEPQRSQIALSDLVLLAISGPGLGPGGEPH